jgi:ketosteroid isomerase-like protein
MSEQQNVALIQSIYDAFKRGDLPFILARLTDDVDWTLEGPSIVPFTGKREGIAQVKEFFEALAGTQTNMKLTMGPLMAQGDRVSGVGRYSATVVATGRSFDSPVGHFFTVRDAKISGFVDLADTAAMVDAYRATAAAAR